MIHFNPCGKAVDFARRPYRTRAKLLKDSDRLFWIDWYPADLEAGTLPFPSGITSLDWHTHPEKKTGIGEAHGQSRNFNNRKKIAGLDPDHVCGTKEEHRYGEVEDATRPPMRYLPSGIPVCCVPDRREAIAEDGETVRSLTLEMTPRVSVPVESDTALSLKDTTTHRYSLVSECDCPDQEWDTYTRRVSLVSECDCPDQEWDTYTRRSATATECDCPVQEGAASVYRYSLVSECDCPDQEWDTYTRRDATATECDCPTSTATTDDPDPPTGPTPGSGCSTAGLLTLDSPVTLDVPEGPGEYWFKFPTTFFAISHVRVAAMSGSGVVNVAIMTGSTCGSLYEVSSLSSVSCYDFYGTGDMAYVRINWPAIGTGTVTFVAGDGSC